VGETAAVIVAVADAGAGAAEGNAPVVVDAPRVVRAADGIFPRPNMHLRKAGKPAATIRADMKTVAVHPAVTIIVARGNAAALTIVVKTAHVAQDLPLPPTVLEPLKILTPPRSVFFSPVNRSRNIATNR
jgi:hypothetical protein